MYVPPKRTEREDSLLWLAMGAAARVWRHTTLNGPAVLIDDVNATIDQHMTENSPDPELTNDERGQIWDLAFLIVEDAWDRFSASSRFVSAALSPAKCHFVFFACFMGKPYDMRTAIFSRDFADDYR